MYFTLISLIELNQSNILDLLNEVIKIRTFFLHLLIGGLKGDKHDPLFTLKHHKFTDQNYDILVS